MLKSLLRWLLPLLLLLGYVVVMQEHPSLNVQSVFAQIEGTGLRGILSFIGLYIVAVLLLLPGQVFIIAGGILFGPLIGAMASLCGASLGALSAFLISRYLRSDWLYRIHNEQVQRVLKGVEEQGWRYVAIVRLLPFMPYDLLSYALGQSHIRTLVYFITTTLCLLPTIVAYTYLGHLGGAAITGDEALWELGLWALLLLGLVGYLPRLLVLLGIGINIRHHHTNGKES